MRIKLIDIIISLIGVIYLLFILNMLTNSNAVQQLTHFVRGLLFLITLFLISKYKNKNIILIFFSLTIFYFLYGVIQGNWVNFIIYDILLSFVFIFIFLLTFNNRDLITKKIIDMLSTLVVFGIVSTLYYFYSNGLEAATSIANRLDSLEMADEEFSLKKGFEVLQVSLVLFPFIWFVDFKRKLIVTFGILVYLIFNLMILSRAGIAASFLVIFLTVLIGIKDKFIRLDLKLASFLFFMTFFSATFINKYYENLETLLLLSTDRFVQGFSGEELVGAIEYKEEPRDIEAREYFNSISSYELIIGQGMGGVNQYPFGKYSPRGMSMMHRGENNLIMKGGIVFFLLVYGLVILSIFKLLLSKTKYGYSFVIVLLSYLLLERGHQQFSQFFMLFFLCMSISYALSIKSRKMYEKKFYRDV